MLCPHCGQPLASTSDRVCPHCGRDVADAPGSAASSAAEAARKAADSAGRAVQDVLDDPRLRERLPGGSLPLLGAGLVTTAVLVPVLPFIGGGLSLPWAFIMLAGSVLLGARELRAAGRPLPSFLTPLADMALHPVFLPLFTGFTVTQAFVELGIGIAPLLWALAAIVLGSVQWRAYRASPASTPELPHRPEALRLKRWVLGGTAACAVALLMPWGVFGADDGLHLRPTVTTTYGGDDSRGSSSGYGYRYALFPDGVSIPGRQRPGAPLAVLSLLALAVLASLRRVSAALPFFVPPLLAAFVTVWGLLGLSARPGPWLFLVGALVVDVAVVRGFLLARGSVKPGS